MDREKALKLFAKCEEVLKEIRDMEAEKEAILAKDAATKTGSVFAVVQTAPDEGSLKVFHIASTEEKAHQFIDRFYEHAFPERVYHGWIYSGSALHVEEWSIDTANTPINYDRVYYTKKF